MQPAPEQKAYANLLATVEALASEQGGELWAPLLRSAVAVVEGAEAGSLWLKDGDCYRCVAQEGFGEWLFEQRLSQEHMIAWHGDLQAWLESEPRIARGAEIQASVQISDVVIRCNLSLPIVLGGEVVALVYLDSLSDENAFSQESVQVMRQYALQATALLAASRRRSELENRSREFEVLQAIGKALQNAQTREEIAQRLVGETLRLMNSQHAAFLWPIAQEGLAVVEATGLFVPFLDHVIPTGQGISWYAIEAGSTLYSEDALSDPRAYNGIQQDAPPHAQLTTPLFDSNGKPLGVLLSARNWPQRYSPHDVRLIEIIASVAANALERVRVTEGLQAEIRQKQALLDLSQLIEGGRPEVLRQALDQVRYLARSDLAVLGVMEKRVFNMRAWSGDLSPGLRAVIEAVPIEVLRELGMAGHRSLFVADTTPYPILQPLRQHGVRSLYVIAVVVEPGMVAGLALMRFVGGGWLPTQQRLIEGAAQMLGALVARLERTRHLEEAYEGALRAIGIALEARDHVTAGHTDRVARLAERLARAVGLSPEQIKAVRWGAYLHDIGKFTIPDSILLKPSPLSLPERQLIQTHTQMGYNLAAHLPFLPEATRQIVLYHHERWDGAGYPIGLAGEAIPLEARIFSVCDVYDALTSKRPYKEAVSPNEAEHELRRMALVGHLDPGLAELFLHLLSVEA